MTRRSEVVDSSELGDVVSATGKEFVVLGHRAAEIAGVGEKDEWSHDGGLSGVDFVFGDRAKHGF